MKYFLFSAVFALSLLPIGCSNNSQPANKTNSGNNVEKENTANTNAQTTKFAPNEIPVGKPLADGTAQTFKNVSLIIPKDWKKVPAAQPDFAVTLHNAVKKEIHGSTDIVKIMASCNVFLGLLAYPDPIRSTALITVMLLLYHRYPKIRASTAEQLFSKLLTLDDLKFSEEDLDEVLALLSETCWDGERDQALLDVRNSLCKFFGLDLAELAAASVAMAASKDDVDHDQIKAQSTAKKIVKKSNKDNDNNAPTYQGENEKN